MSTRRTYYHATPMENLVQISCEGIKPSFDGVVYMTEKEVDAVKFLAIRGIKNIVTFKIKIGKPENVIETFDHSEAFFGCRCFGYTGEIPASWITPSKKYEL